MDTQTGVILPARGLPRIGGFQYYWLCFPSVEDSIANTDICPTGPSMEENYWMSAVVTAPFSA